VSEQRGPANRVALLGTLGAACGATILLMAALLGGGEDADAGRADPPRAELPFVTVITEESAPSDAYCEWVIRTVSLDEGTEPAVYLGELNQARSLAPNEHVEMWKLLSRVVDEPFSYDNFNPAADETDRVLPMVIDLCADLPPVVINDDGRLITHP